MEFDETPGLLKYIELECYLSDLLGIKVDLVTRTGLKPNVGKRVPNEVVSIDLQFDDAQSFSVAKLLQAS